MICAIHQPNFFPWYPWFQKAADADVFVLLTECQFEKNNYQNRFHLNGQWHTMSVSRHIEKICDKKYLSPTKDWDHIKARLRKYKLERFDDCITEDLMETNVSIIMQIKNDLGIGTKFILDKPTGLTRDARLVRLCQNNGCNTYLSGIGGRSYLDLEVFRNAGIEVVFQKEEAMRREPVLEVLHERI